MKNSKWPIVFFYISNYTCIWPPLSIMPAGGSTQTSYRTLVPRLFRVVAALFLFLYLTEQLHTEIKMVIRQENYEERRNSHTLTGRIKKKKQNSKG